MKDKTCGRCKRILPIENFRFKSEARGTYQSYCIVCNKEKNREHYQANKEAYRKKAREWEAANFGSKQAYRHSLTKVELDALLALGDHKCWLCKERVATIVDHDHSCCSGYKTCGKCIRGMLCKGCNTGLGLLGDTIESLKAAVAYLEPRT